MVRDRFICVTDGVGGWANRGVDVGLFTKEFVKHIGSLYDSRKCKSLKEILDQASQMTKATGTSTCVMAEVNDGGDKLLTCNLGDSAYLLLRAENVWSTQVRLDKVFRSES